MTAESSPDVSKPEEIARGSSEPIRGGSEPIPGEDSGSSPFSGFDSVPSLEGLEEFERDMRELSGRLGEIMGDTLSWLDEKLSGFPDIPS